MKKFVKKLVLFFILSLVILLPLDFLISKELKKTSLAASEYEVWNDMLYLKVTPEIAIYGSSRAWVHINPEILEDSLFLSAYNFGIDGHSFDLQHFRHKILLENAIPNIIIHSVDINTLRKRKDLYNLNQFLPYMLWDTEFYAATRSYEGFDLIDFTVPLARYIRNNKVLDALLYAPKNKPIRTKGFKGQDLNWNDDLKRAQESLGSFTVSLDSASVTLFEEYIIDCKKRGINIILVYTPEYIEGQLFVKNRSEIISTLTNLAIQNNIPFLDYSEHELSFNKDYFYNSMHLNAKGADIFSRILAHDIKQLIANKDVFLKED
jgi:hypothetical protein